MSRIVREIVYIGYVKRHAGLRSCQEADARILAGAQHIRPNVAPRSVVR